MSQDKRVKKLETSLTPKQRILLWLEEALKFENSEYFEQLFTSPTSGSLRHEIADNVALAVGPHLKNSDWNARGAAGAELQAEKRVTFLMVLAFETNFAVQLQQSQPYAALLGLQLPLMCKEFQEQGIADSAAWNTWRSTLINQLRDLWLLRSMINKIREQYFDGHDILFVDNASILAKSIEFMDYIVEFYNSLGGNPPAWHAIDTVNLQTEVEGQVPAAVERTVAVAKATTLLRFGDWAAASRVLEPHWRHDFLRRAGIETKSVDVPT
jgi:hypothetical protein